MTSSERVPTTHGDTPGGALDAARTATATRSTGLISRFVRYGRSVTFVAAARSWAG